MPMFARIKLQEKTVYKKKNLLVQCTQPKIELKTFNDLVVIALIAVWPTSMTNNGLDNT